MLRHTIISSYAQSLFDARHGLLAYEAVRRNEIVSFKTLSKKGRDSHLPKTVLNHIYILFWVAISTTVALSGHYTVTPPPVRRQPHSHGCRDSEAARRHTRSEHEPVRTSPG
jgi:hypothetical protein